MIPGDALIDSSPQGAAFQVDGKGDPSWVTPFNVTGLSPGKHIISAGKSGYVSEIRSVDVTGGGKASLLLHLSAMNALMVVNSTPVGAEVILDGKPTKRVTPAQFAVEKGSHTVLLRKQGYLDETITADLGPAQNFQYAPALRALGNTEDMRTVGRLAKLFGRGGESTADTGSVIIRTQPKGAQVAINQRLLDKAIASWRRFGTGKLHCGYHADRFQAGPQDHQRRKGRQGRDRRDSGAAVSTLGFGESPGSPVVSPGLTPSIH